MYMLLFCALTVAGSWVAWRRNPMYSTRSTLRMLAAVLLMIAGMVGVIVATFNVAIKQPQAAALPSCSASSPCLPWR